MCVPRKCDCHLYFIVGLIVHFLCSSLLATEPSLPDVEKFLGERVYLVQPYPSKIKKLNLKLTLSEGYKLLAKADSHLRLFSPDGGLDRIFKIKGAISSFAVKEEVLTEKLFAELSLYYCKQGKEGLCLIKKVLLEMKIQDTKEFQDMELLYEVPVAPS